VGELWEPEPLEQPPCPQPEWVKEAAKEGVGVALDCFKARFEQHLGSYAAEPVVLAEDSESADVRADLVDVGEGTKERHGHSWSR
jgi:hypothetical protein